MLMFKLNGPHMNNFVILNPRLQHNTELAVTILWLYLYYILRKKGQMCEKNIYFFFKLAHSKEMSAVLEDSAEQETFKLHKRNDVFLLC